MGIYQENLYCYIVLFGALKWKSVYHIRVFYNIKLGVKGGRTPSPSSSATFTSIETHLSMSNLAI